MIKNNTALCLFTSTLGHFDRHDIYRQTVDGLLGHIAPEFWGDLRAHIKYGGERVKGIEAAADMDKWLRDHKFKVESTQGIWAHGQESHQMGYILDAYKIISTVTAPYIFWCEDDWLIKSYDRSLEYWMSEAQKLLNINPSLVQIRIARFSDELNRINGLKAKHNIDGIAKYFKNEDDPFFFHNDWSCNPFIARTRDLRATLVFFLKTFRPLNMPVHVEHGFGRMVGALADAPLPYACFNPKYIRCGHLGTKTPEEADNLELPLMAN